MMAWQVDTRALSDLIRQAREGRPISPLRFVDQVMYDIQELETWAKLEPGTPELAPGHPCLQAYMRGSLQVIDALLAMSFTPTNALFWFRSFRIVEMKDQTPIRALSEDCAKIVIESLQRVFVVDYDELGCHYERMREDTQAVQKEIFQDLRVICAAEAARIMNIESAGRSPMQIARTIEDTKRAIFIMNGRVPVFPACQFDSAGPKRIVAGLIKTLAPYRSGWEIVAWLWARNGWLGGASPVDLLDEKPILVLDAAFQDVVEEIESDRGE
jgi:hypothetical protein